MVIRVIRAIRGSKKPSRSRHRGHNLNHTLNLNHFYLPNRSIYYAKTECQNGIFETLVSSKGLRLGLRVGIPGAIVLMP